MFSLTYRYVSYIEINAFHEETELRSGGSSTRFFIFDAVSRVNHPCYPNLEHYIDDDDDYMYCIATRPIKTGEQIFINYLCNMKFKSTEEWKEYIKKTGIFIAIAESVDQLFNCIDSNVFPKGVKQLHLVTSQVNNCYNNSKIFEH